MEVATVGSFSSPLCLRVSFHALQPLSVSTWAHTIVYSHAITSTVSHTALLLTSTAPGGRHTQSFAQILPEGCWGPGGRGGGPSSGMVEQQCGGMGCAHGSPVCASRGGGQARM